MRIVHLMRYTAPQLGYEEYYLAKIMQEWGHQVYFVTSDRYAPIPDYDATLGKLLGPRIRGKGVFREGPFTVYRLATPIEYKGTCLPCGLEKVLEILAPDVIHCHEVFYSSLAYQAATLKTKLGYKLIYDQHAAPFNTDLWGDPIKRLWHLLFRTLLWPKMRDNASAIVAIGEGYRDGRK